MTDDDRPIRTPLRQWLREAKERFGPASVWLCAVVVVTWLFVGRAVQWKFTPFEYGPDPDAIASTVPAYPDAVPPVTTARALDADVAGHMYVAGIRTHRQAP